MNDSMGPSSPLSNQQQKDNDEKSGKQGKLDADQQRKHEENDDDIRENIYNYTLEGMREKYSSLLENTSGSVSVNFANCKIYVFKLRRERADESLGLSLSGNVNLNKTSVFVCGIYANSIAQKHGLIRVGDQILEINGHCLYGRAHSNVTPLIRNIKDLDVYLVILRNEENLNQMFMPTFQTMSSSKSNSGSQSPSSVQNETAMIVSPSYEQPKDIAQHDLVVGDTDKSLSSTVYLNENPLRKIVIKKSPTGFGIAISEDKQKRLIVRGLNPSGVAFSVSILFYLNLFALICFLSNVVTCNPCRFKVPNIFVKEIMHEF